MLITVYVDSMHPDDYVESIWSINTGNKRAFTARPDGLIIGVEFSANAVPALILGLSGNFIVGIVQGDFRAAHRFADKILRS